MKRIMFAILVVAVIGVPLATVAAQSLAKPSTTQRELAGNTGDIIAVAWASNERLVCNDSRWLIFGHAVPEGEWWDLTSMHIKDNSGDAKEINVAFYSFAIGAWVCVASKADPEQYDGLSWAGNIRLGVHDQLGWWVRDCTPGDVIQVDATYTRYIYVSDELASPLVTEAQVLEKPDNKTPYLQ